MGVARLAEGLPRGAQRAIAWWLGTCAAWVASMVVLGGLTRLTRSGLSMTDWKFTGERPPLSAADWEAEFAKYHGSPEYRRMNRHFVLPSQSKHPPPPPKKKWKNKKSEKVFIPAVEDGRGFCGGVGAAWELDAWGMGGHTFDCLTHISVSRDSVSTSVEHLQSLHTPVSNCSVGTCVSL